MNDGRPWLRFYGKVPVELAHPEVTLYEALSQTARKSPDAIAWDFFDTTATYKSFLESIDRCANALAALGLDASERILISMPNSPQAIIAFYAANKLGAVAALVHPLSTIPELEHYLNASAARFVLTLDAFYERVASAQPVLPIQRIILAKIGDYLPPIKNLGFWLAKGRKIGKVPADERVRWWAALMSDRQKEAPRASTTSHDAAAILFSGGTTGKPKGVVLSNRNFISQGMAAASWVGDYEGVNSILAIMPIFHGFGLGVCVNAALLNGGRSILVPTFSADLVAEMLRKKRPNIIAGVPTLYSALLRNRSLQNIDLSCLRVSFAGADRLPRPLKEEFEKFVIERGGRGNLLDGYGLTEAVTAVMAMPEGEYREGSIGVPFPGVLAKICSPGTEVEVTFGEDGEICISGPSVMMGYLDEPEATAQVLRQHSDGRLWLHTGDLGQMDADGFFYFKERMKRLIKSSGFNVFPAQVESALYAHPLVRQACVAGVPDERQIERVKGFVVLKDPTLASKETEQALIEHCHSQLIKWSCPREIAFLDELPQTRLGKIDYKALIEIHMQKESEQCAREFSIAHGGDLVAHCLQNHGVRHLFTLCGGHISPILTGSKKVGIRVIDVRHEATAVFAADAMARLTGVPGVAAVTAGPGLTNTITALKNAQLAQSPIVLLAGAVPTLLAGKGALQDIDQRQLVAPHVKAIKQVRRLRDIAPSITEAFKVAAEGVPGPVVIELPVDLLYDEKTVRSSYSKATAKGGSASKRIKSWYIEHHLQNIFASNGDGDGDGKDVVRVHQVAQSTTSGSVIAAAIAALRRAERPLLLLGSQAVAVPHAVHALALAVNKLGVPVYLSGMARGLLGRNHPLQMHHGRRHALAEADCVVLAGVPLDFRMDYGRTLKRSTTVIAINRSSKDAYLNRRPDICAIADAGQFIITLADKYESRQADLAQWIDRLTQSDKDREQEICQLAAQPGDYVNPLALLREIENSAADDAVIVADGGDFVGSASYIVKPRAPLSWMDPGAFGTLGAGAGFALAAALCRPGAQIWLLWGDGACGYGIAEIDTFARHSIPVIAVVGNDASWSQIARDQIRILQDDVGTKLARTAYHRAASGFGAKGILLKNIASAQAAIRQASLVCVAGKPVLINAWIDRTDFRQGSVSM
jgi:acyl-CoA synthetase (AMP-forming)/AMP-acid ligase II/thiamine pyrophosphate-dependent acetolactate synthase large subunit-like protein